ncbi:hypothetical protein OEZ85_006820 [Tetradesmus obliquus]|uniref:Chlorophyllase n=1 Tax=Tetradesmus obliquus TaxID=3088 RepID=A0ABY8TVS5_TETOB|nr:hypothetical protein OEZ85_006820 [Tetradesmus obliquus]
MRLQSPGPWQLQQRCAAQYVLRAGWRPQVVHHVKPMCKPTAQFGGIRAATKTVELDTMYSGGREAIWLAPQGGLQAARGVVLFMHGFAQGPEAYYENLRGLADAGLLVVAPAPPFKPCRTELQGFMVEYAAHFHSKLVNNSLDGLVLPSEAAKNIGLLSHSIGAGLATYMAQQAAKEHTPFKAVMYMAPQTQLVVEAYLPATAITEWPQQYLHSTDFALQYGGQDLLAPPCPCEELKEQLSAKGLPLQLPVKIFPWGTHVGFQDQLVIGGLQVVSDILPMINHALAALLWIVSKEQPQALTPKGKTVKIPSAEDSWWQYSILLTLVTAFGVLFFSKAFQDGEVHRWWLVGAVGAGCTALFGVYNLALLNYVITVQRPESREVAKTFFTETLLTNKSAR